MAATAPRLCRGALGRENRRTHGIKDVPWLPARSTCSFAVKIGRDRIAMMDIEKTMAFILEQQAQFTADMQATRASFEKHDAEIAEIRKLSAANTESIRQLIDVSMSLAHNAAEMEETDRRLAARLQELAESGAHTDRRLDVLIDIVNKLTRRNGGAS